MTEQEQLKIIDFYGQKHVQLQCALCAKNGKNTLIYIDSHAYSINRYGTACCNCISFELKKEKECRNKNDINWRYHSQYLPPKLLSVMKWDELILQDKQDTERIEIQQQESHELNERNMSVARQFALGVQDTEEQRAKYTKIFTNKGPWKREISGQILEPEEQEHPASWQLNDIYKKTYGISWIRPPRADS